MLAALVPLFDSKLFVCAYSVFAQKDNFFTNPGMNGVTRLDGAGNIVGLDIVNSLGAETFSDNKLVFIQLNSISVFSNVEEQCKIPKSSLVLLMDKNIVPNEKYLLRLKQLKETGFKLAIRKLPIEEFENYKDILSIMDYILLDSKKIKMEVAKVYFKRQYPNIKLCAVNVNDQESYNRLVADGGYDMYEGAFFRMPIKRSEREIAPLKINYVQLLNVVNSPDYNLSDAASVIGHDTALVVSLLEMVNRMTAAGGVQNVNHAAAMLGQKELKRWISTAITKELLSDKPTEIMRLSLIRARFAENLSKVFELAAFSQDLFLAGMFSVVDIMLDKPMEEALSVLKVSKNIEDALIRKSGPLYPVINFVYEYENASWQEVSRLMVLGNYEMDEIYGMYIEAIRWYGNLFKTGA